jgi:C4-dicarboxylate transporter, DctM subunit
MTIAFLFVMLFGLLLIGAPIAIALGLSSVTSILLFSHDSLASLALKLFETMQHYTLLAIPFFILSSAFLSTGGVARRLIRFALACVGHLRGGLAMASVLACMLFAAVSGSSPATVVAIGSIVIAGMVGAGYSKAFAAGVICNAGTLGILIPPSIVMVVYAAATDSSVGRLFLAGVVPGIVAGLMLMVGIYIAARVTDLPRQPRANWREILAAGREAIWGLLLIVLIMGGIYGGVFTPTEAAAVAAVYAFLIALFVYRDMGPLKGRTGDSLIQGLVRGLIYLPYALVHRDTRHVMIEAGRTTIMLMFIIANAMLFAHVLTTERIPHAITEAIVSAGLPSWAFLIVVNILLLIAGNFMEPSAILLIMAPILFPIALQLGIDPIHLGIIMVVNMEIGMITPPVGLNLFVTSGITGMSILEVVKAALPWLGILLLFLILVTYVPIISTLLPDLLYGPQIL